MSRFYQFDCKETKDCRCPLCQEKQELVRTGTIVRTLRSELSDALAVLDAARLESYIHNDGSETGDYNPCVCDLCQAIRKLDKEV